MSSRTRRYANVGESGYVVCCYVTCRISQPGHVKQFAHSHMARALAGSGSVDAATQHTDIALAAHPSAANAELLNHHTPAPRQAPPLRLRREGVAGSRRQGPLQEEEGGGGATAGEKAVGSQMEPGGGELGRGWVVCTPKGWVGTRSSPTTRPQWSKRDLQGKVVETNIKRRDRDPGQL